VDEKSWAALFGEQTANCCVVGGRGERYRAQCASMGELKLADEVLSIY